MELLSVYARGFLLICARLWGKEMYGEVVR